MKLDVSGAIPWSGAPEAPVGDWSEYRVTFEGDERPSRWGRPDGTGGIEADRTYVFAFSRMETPPGHRPRRVPYELVLRYMVVERPGSPARLVLYVAADAIRLELAGERRQKAVHALLRALPLMELPPDTGRPPGSTQHEDLAALQAQINAQAATLRRNKTKVSIRSLATAMGYDESALGRKIRRLGLTVPRDL